LIIIPIFIIETEEKVYFITIDINYHYKLKFSMLQFLIFLF